MTKSVRFSPLARAGVFAVGAVLLAAPTSASDVPFTAQPPISTIANGADFVGAADIDGDGDLDALSASYYDDKIAWYENVGGSGSAWVLHTIDAAADGTYAAVAADVDGDGDLDVVSAAGVGDRVAWHENTAGNGSAWTLHTISSANFPRSVFAADLDGDGDVDVLSATTFENKIAWHENLAGNGSTWALHTISLSADAAFSVYAADVDGDGDLDALSVSANDDKVAWYENTAGNGSAWSLHTISTAADGARSVFAADLDGDGDVDVLSASREDDTLAWYENTAGNGSAWTLRTISTAGDGVRSVFAADADGDGDLDVLSAASFNNEIAWHENVAGNGSVWVRRTISASALGAHAVLAADLDGDGDLDALSASAIDDKIAWYRNDTIHEGACFRPPAPVSPVNGIAAGVATVDVDGDGDLDAMVALNTYVGHVMWYENAAGDGSAWTSHSIADGTDLAQSVAPADVDGDGDIDTFSIGYYTGLRWHRNNGGGASWTAFPIGTTGHAVAAADVDGDGDADAISSMDYFDSTVKWYENTAGNGSAWSLHTIFVATVGSPAFGLVAADLDGDGDMDVASTIDPGAIPHGILWFENTAGNGTAWTPHTVAQDHAHSLAAGDVDGDGDLDLVSVGKWFENVTGTGSVWAAHDVSSPEQAVAVADLDADGDLDIVHAGSTVSWSENVSGDGSAWSESALIPPGNPGLGVAVGDLNGDGQRDVLASTGLVDVVWVPHQGGQFSLDAANVSPGSAANGDLVPMLRLYTANRGRPGDGDLELASLGLLFEEATGDPLTSAEANALIENLHVYRDANGNGLFDPGDTIVITVTTLSLVNGVQTVGFADGDPNVQVSPSIPWVYFVVTELTADAGGQSPNQFQVTHLGTGHSHSVVEDRTYDIPLRPACPANVMAAVGPITPVGLQAFTVE